MVEDPTMRLTDYLTRMRMDKLEIERSRLLAPEQKKFYHGELFFAEILPEMNFIIDILLHDIYQMVAYKGKSREEVTHSLASTEKEDIYQSNASIFESVRAKERRLRERD